MEKEQFYHMFANGDDAQNLIVSNRDFIVIFNLIAICSANNPDVRVVSFSIEETHPHLLLYGRRSACERFKKMFESSVLHHIAATRGTLDNVVLECEILEVEDDEYLLNVGVYTIFQATKDGKAVMPYDYLWGSGALYFRDKRSALPWLFDEDGNKLEPVRIGSLTMAERKRIECSRMAVPDDWLVCNGLILPTNYVDVELFESIYTTHNRYRVFMGNSSKKNQVVLERMARTRGIRLDDLEVRRLAENECTLLFGKKTARWLTTEERLRLARQLRSKYGIMFRQLATVCRLPESELSKYLK